MSSDESAAVTPTPSGADSAFAGVWFASSLAYSAFQVAHFALPLVAALTLGAGPAHLGALSAAFFIPNVLFGLTAGVWADRFQPRSLLVAAEFVSATAAAAVPMAAGLGLLSVELLYVTAFVLGASTIHFDAAAAAFLPRLVQRSDLAQANSRLQLSVSIARVLCPSSAGVLIQWISAPYAFLASAVLFLLGGFGFLTLVPRAPHVSSVNRRPMGRQIADGLRYLGRSRAVGGLTMFTTISGGFGAATLAIFPLYALGLGLTPSMLGLTLAANGAGGIVGGVVSSAIGRRVAVGPVTVVAGLGLCLGLWLTPLAGGVSELAVPVLLASRFVVGLALIIYAGHMSALQQAVTPDEMQGRVFGSIRFLRYGSLTLGAALGGFLAETAGLWETTALSAAGSTLALASLGAARIWTVALPSDGVRAS